jgi:hypothetical protein
VFGIEFFDPKTVWINLTNLALGLVTLVCVAMVAWGVAAEAAERLRRRLAVFRDDHHAFAVPELGLTMADGGDKVDDDEQKQ